MVLSAFLQKRRKVLETLEDNEDDDERLLMQMAANIRRKRKKRAPKNRIKRTDLDEHFSTLLNTTELDYTRRYHMTEETFEKLERLLHDRIAVDAKQSSRSTSGNAPITEREIVGIGVRFLGGVELVEMAEIFGISYQSAHRLVHKFLDAVLEEPTLRIDLPQDPQELKNLADDWHNLVSDAQGTFYGVVGAIDGWLAHTNRPARDEAPNQVDYFSGHYHRYGLNIQAVCDAKCRFLYFAVASPGKTNDSRAFARCDELQKWIGNLPNEYFIIGDNAYPISNKVIIPFNQADDIDETKETYNYFLSQQRIRIECAFGRMTKKWAIFRSNLRCSLETSSKICEAVARLHNFVIDNDLKHLEENSEFNSERPKPLDPNNVPLPPSDDTDIHQRRNAIVAKVVGAQLARPQHNIQRNANRRGHA